MSINTLSFVLNSTFSKRIYYFPVLEVNLKGEASATKYWEILQKIFENVAATTEIVPQYAEDIDRWSAIALPSKQTRLLRKIGKVEVRILAPALWAIGKLTRFLGHDIEDLIVVLKKTKTSPRLCAQVWGQALKISPASPMQFTFRRQVETFFDQYGKATWVSKINPQNLKDIFRNASSDK